jgi:hypothetical protein
MPAGMLRILRLAAASLVLVIFCCVVALRRGEDLPFVRPAGTPPGPVKILRFYASAGMLVTGEKAELCYGVENAKSVRIAPLSGDILPSARRCLEIVPKHTTHYTILAEGFDGKVAMQSLTLAVRPPEEAPGPVVHWVTLRSRRELPVSSKT